MAIPVSGVPDQNNKPSLVLFDSTASVTFAWEGSHTLGAAYVQIVDNSGTPIVSFGGITNPSIGSAVPSTANYIAASKSGTLTGLLMGSQTTANSLAVALASDQVSIPVTGTFWQATQPVSGTVTANQGTSPWLVEQSATLAITPLNVAIAASSSGDNTLIAAQGVGKVVYVYAFEMSFSGTVNAKFTDGAAGTNLGGLYYGVANAGAANSVAPPYYLFKGTANTALILNLSGATPVGGRISYFVI